MLEDLELATVRFTQLPLGLLARQILKLGWGVKVRVQHTDEVYALRQRGITLELKGVIQYLALCRRTNMHGDSRAYLLTRENDGQWHLRRLPCSYQDAVQVLEYIRRYYTTQPY